MALAILNSNNQIGMELDALAPTLPAEDITTMPRLRAVEAVFTAAKAAADAAVANPAWAELGVKLEAIKVMSAAGEAMKSHQAETDRLAAIAAETRTQALQPPPTFTPDAAISREIRDRLQGMEPLEIRVQYYAAIGRDDWAFVHAVEHAPQAFALLDADSLEQGAQMRLGRSPLKATLDSQELTARRHASTVAATKNELRRLAKQFGIVED